MQHIWIFAALHLIVFAQLVLCSSLLSPESPRSKEETIPSSSSSFSSSSSSSSPSHSSPSSASASRRLTDPVDPEEAGGRDLEAKGQDLEAKGQDLEAKGHIWTKDLEKAAAIKREAWNGRAVTGYPVVGYPAAQGKLSKDKGETNLVVVYRGTWESILPLASPQPQVAGHLSWDERNERNRFGEIYISWDGKNNGWTLTWQDDNPTTVSLTAPEYADVFCNAEKCTFPHEIDPKTGKACEMIYDPTSPTYIRNGGNGCPNSFLTGSKADTLQVQVLSIKQPIATIHFRTPTPSLFATRGHDGTLRERMARTGRVVSFEGPPRSQLLQKPTNGLMMRLVIRALARDLLTKSLT